MSGLSVTIKDLHRLLDLTDLAKLDEPGNPLPWSLLYGLSDLVGCDSVIYESHDVISRTVQHQQVISGVDGGDGFSDESVQASFRILYCRGLCEDWPRIDDDASSGRMLAERQSPTWQDSAYAAQVLRIGIHGAINIPLPSEAGLRSRLLLWRFIGQDFTQRDCLLLTLIYPRLAALHDAVLSRQANAIDLTPRQWQLMHLIAAGATNRQIARRLGLSEGTVRTHCENIFQRLKVTNRVAAIARAFPTKTVSMTPV